MCSLFFMDVLFILYVRCLHRSRFYTYLLVYYPKKQVSKGLFALSSQFFQYLYRRFLCVVFTRRTSSGERYGLFLSASITGCSPLGVSV